MKKTAITPEIAFGQVLKELRTAKGLSQEQLALNSELDRTFISMLERGKRQPSLTSIIAIADQLDTQPYKLVRLTSDLLSKE